MLSCNRFDNQLSKARRIFLHSEFPFLNFVNIFPNHQEENIIRKLKLVCIELHLIKTETVKVRGEKGYIHINSVKDTFRNSKELYLGYIREA